MISMRFTRNIFSFLCLLIALHGGLSREIHYNSLLSELVDDVIDYRSKAHHENDQTGDVKSYTRQKRWVIPVLIGVELISGAFDVYKDVADCKPTNPKLYENLHEYEKKRIQLRDMRTSQIPRWNKIHDSQGYLRRLQSTLVIIEKRIELIDKTEREIVTLLDSDFMKRMNKTAVEIEEDLKQHSSNGTSPSIFLERFYINDRVARRSSKTIAPLAPWLGTKNLGTYISASATRSTARKEFSIDEFSRYFDEINFSTWAKTRTTIARFVASSTVDVTSSLRLLSNTGKFAITGLVLAVEIYSAWRFFADCQKKEDESHEMLRVAEQSIANMTRLSNTLDEINRKIVGNYSKVFDGIISNDFIASIKDIKEMAISAQVQNESLDKNAMEYQAFLNEISSTKSGELQFNFARIDQLVNILSSALLTTAQRLDCYKRKLAIIMQLKISCENGYGAMENMLAVSFSESEKLKSCFSSSNTKLEKNVTIGVIKSFMAAENKSSVCVRNNKVVKHRVCSLMYQELNKTTIKGRLSNGADLNDIDYFMSKCSMRELTPDIKSSICFLKSQNKNMTEVESSYKFYNSAQIKYMYRHTCALTARQKKQICELKGNGEVLSKIQTLYRYYSGLQKAFDDCGNIPGEVVIQKTCFYSRLVSHGNPSHPVHADAVRKFGLENIQKILSQCPKKQT